MQASTLKNPGDNPLAQTVRKELARLISNHEDAAVFGTPDPALAAFLLDAATKTPGYAAPTLPATQTVVSNAQAVTVGGATYTFTVAGGVITAIVVS